MRHVAHDELYQPGALLTEFDRECAYCPAPLTHRTKTAEHLIPKSRGGRRVSWNIVFACAACNEARADHPLLAWLLARPVSARKLARILDRYDRALSKALEGSL